MMKKNIYIYIYIYIYSDSFGPLVIIYTYLNHFVVHLKLTQYERESMVHFVAQSRLTLCDPMDWLLCPWGFSRQEYWSGLPCPSPGNLLNPEIALRSPTLQVNS